MDRQCCQCSPYDFLPALLVRDIMQSLKTPPACSVQRSQAQPPLLAGSAGFNKLAIAMLQDQASVLGQALHSLQELGILRAPGLLQQGKCSVKFCSCSPRC